VIVLDVGKSMREYGNNEECKLDKARFAVRKLIIHKLMFTKRDEIGVVLVGTKKTDHILKQEESDLEGYENIATLRPIAKPDLQLVEQLSSLEDKFDPSPDARGDILDGIVVAMKMLRERVGKLKFTKKIYVLSDAAVEIDRGSVDVIEQALVLGDFKLNFIGMDFDDNFDDEDDETEQSDDSADRASSAPQSIEEYKQKVQEILDVSAAQGIQRTQIMAENELFLRTFVRKVKGALLSCSTAEELLTAFCSKAVLQVTKMRGYLQLGLDSKYNERISVWTYGKTAVVNMPTLKRLSVKAEAAEAAARAAVQAYQDGDGMDDDGDDEKGASDEVAAERVCAQMNRIYSKASDPGSLIDEASQGRAFRYGSDFVPIDEQVLNALKLEWNKGITILAFVPASAIGRHDFIGVCDVVVPEPNKPASACAVSALTRAMIEKNVIAVVKYVKRQNANPILGVLTPTVLDTVDCWFLNQIPFAEDIRDYTFPSLARQVKPTEQQLLAAESLIVNMSLDEDTVRDQDGELVTFEELYKPTIVFNPALQRFYQLIETRAFDPTASLEFALSPDVAGAAPAVYDPKEIWRPGLPPLENSGDMAIKSEKSSRYKTDPRLTSRIDAIIASHPRVTVYGTASQAHYKMLFPVEKRVFEDGSARERKPQWRDYLSFEDGKSTKPGEEGFAKPKQQDSDDASTLGALPSTTSRYAFKREHDGQDDMTSVISSATSSSGSSSSSSSSFSSNVAVFSATGFVPESIPGSVAVGSADPIQDIRVHMQDARKKKLSRPNYAASVAEAITRQCFARILALVYESFGDSLYDRACDCAHAMRESIINFVLNGASERPSMRDLADPVMLGQNELDVFVCRLYHTQVKALRDKLRDDKPDFWEVFQSYPNGSLAPIANSEVDGLAVGFRIEDVDKFWNDHDDDSFSAGVIAAPQPERPQPQAPVQQEEDLFGDLE